MSDSTAIKQSLQEIATLLYYMYDHYLKVSSRMFIHILSALCSHMLMQDLAKGQSLDALMAFLGDLGLLGNRVSVFEAEQVRQEIMSQPDVVPSSGDSITYEQFYAWLRGVSTLYYASEESSSRKALHRMLTQKIIPLASSWGVFRYSSCVRNGVNGSILQGMQQHNMFLRFWYFHISNEV